MSELERPGWLATSEEELPPPTAADRSYRHHDAPVDRALLLAHDGLTLIRMMQKGEIPGSPMWQTADTRIAAAEDGLVVFEAAALPFTHNFGGTAHGGWTATLLDSAMGLAVMTRSPKGVLHTTIELSIRFVRAITPAVGTVRVEGRLVHAGRRMATAEGRVVDSDGRLYAHGATSCMLLDLTRS